MTHARNTYIAGAVAEVACVLIAPGPFLTIAIPAGAGVADNCLVIGHCVRRARRARFLAGFDRSILGGVEFSYNEKKKRGSREEDASNGSI